MKKKRKNGIEESVPANPPEMINSHEEFYNLDETKKFVKRLKIQNGIIKKIIDPIYSSQTLKNRDESKS